MQINIYSVQIIKHNSKNKLQNNENERMKYFSSSSTLSFCRRHWTGERNREARRSSSRRGGNHHFGFLLRFSPPVPSPSPPPRLIVTTTTPPPTQHGPPCPRARAHIQRLPASPGRSFYTRCSRPGFHSTAAGRPGLLRFQASLAPAL
jgi:hypothetical protein